MSQGTRADDSVSRLVGRLQSGAATDSVLRCAERVLRRAEPAARAACRAEAGGLPPERVEELVQDTLEVVWTKLPDFHPEGPRFESWVRGIARNACRNDRRKRRDLLSEDGLLEATEPAHSVLRRLQREHRHALITTAIETCLQGIEQDVVYHRYCQELSRSRIAELLGLTTADEVRVILVRASRRLRKEILTRVAQLDHSTSFLHSQEG